MTIGLEGGAREETSVPFRALGLSVLALAAPAFGAVLASDWIGDDSGMILWLSALVPPFLLTYYRGWRGASVGLAGGMAALALAQVVIVLMDAGSPDYSLLLWMVSTYILVCVGIGVLAELLRRERSAAEAMALTDPLTGLPNRRHAGIFLDAGFSAAMRGQPLTIVFFDLDHFKRVNDRFGHRAGDEALRVFAGLLTDATRRMNLSARWGGEEFLSILSSCDARGGRVFAERVQRELREYRFPWGTVTVSAGVAQYLPGMGSPELLLAAADQALYAAKEAGRDRVRTAEPVTTVATEVAEVGRLLRGEEGHRVEALDPRRTVGEPAEGGGSHGSGLPGGTESILLVDDDPGVRGAVSRTLSRLGYRVTEAESGAHALDLVEGGGQFDLILTDLLMPGMSGFTLGARIQARTDPVRILYMSGYVQGELSWRGAPGAVTGFVEKPLSTPELARQLREMMETPLPPS